MIDNRKVNELSDRRLTNFAKLPNETINNDLRMARYLVKKALSYGKSTVFPVEAMKP